MDDCIFCKIVKGELPSSKIYENNDVLAFLDIAPVNIGHSLVIPKKHYENIYEIPESIWTQIAQVTKNLSGAIKDGVKADGMNVAMSNGQDAGQVVFHAHVHIIPRVKNDGFELWHSKRPYAEGEMEETTKRIIGEI